jgi:hypothetical protein
MTRSSAQLEQEVEQARAQLQATLDELRTRITPGAVVDQLVEYGRESGAGDFVRNLGRQTRDNPLAVTLIGGGLAWLMMSGRGSSKADGLSDSASETAQRIGDTVSGTYESTARSVGDAATRVADTTSAMTRGAGDLTRSLVDLCREQPLILGGIGIAVGAMVGAALPSTETENRLMGEKSEELKERARSTAAEAAQTGLEDAKTAAAQELERAQSGSIVPAPNTADDHGPR